MSLLRKDRVWPTIVVLVLASYVAFGVIAARVASHDPNYAIESDYYAKAVAFDSTLAQDRRSAALGWHVMPMLGAIGAAGAELSFVLCDSSGSPVRGAEMQVEARQVAHADEVMRATLAARELGMYAARLPLRRPGLWEFRVVATRGGDRFATQVRMDASTGAVGTVVAERPGDAPAARLEAGTGRRTP